MRRSRRFSAITAASRLFSQPNSDISDNSSSSESSDSDSDMDTNVVVEERGEWQIINKDNDTYEPEHSFAANPGLQRSQLPTTSDVEYFINMYLTDELFEMLTSWTNIRAKIALESHDIDSMEFKWRTSCSHNRLQAIACPKAVVAQNK